MQWHPEADAASTRRSARSSRGARAARHARVAGGAAERPARPSASRARIYSPPQCGCRRAIRATAWGVVAAGVAAPLVRKRVSAPPLRHAGRRVRRAGRPVRRRAPLAHARRGGLRLQMWAYLAAYKTPHDDATAPGASACTSTTRSTSTACSGSASCRRVRLQRALARIEPPTARRAGARSTRARVGALGVVHGAARRAGLHPRAPARALPARRGDDLRGVRHRRERLLARCRPRRPGMRRRWRVARITARSRRAPDDGRVRRALLERRLGAPLQCASEAIPWLRCPRCTSPHP